MSPTLSLAPIHDRLDDWHAYFEELNEATKDMGFISLTDMAFVAQCLTRYCEDAAIREGISVSTIAMAYAELVIIGCQHTRDARAYWPSADEWTRLRALVAGVVAVYLDTSKRVRTELIVRIGDERFAFEDMPDRLRYPFLSRKTPPSLLDEKEKRRKEQEAKKGRGTGSSSSSRDEVSEEASGLMWRNSAEELVGNFVRLAARTVHVVERDQAVRDLFPHKDAPRFTRQTIARGERWVVTKCQVEQTEELTMLFRNMANEWFWPLGASTHGSRSATSSHTKSDALTVLADELGVDLSQHIHDRSLARLDTLAADTAGLFWDPLFTALLVYMIQQRVRMDWRKHYLFMEAHKAVARMSAEHYMGADKRPIVLFCCRRWLVYHAGAYLDCTNLLHAVLTWLYIVQTEFACEMENTEDLREICAVFLEPGTRSVVA